MNYNIYVCNGGSVKILAPRLCGLYPCFDGTFVVFGAFFWIVLEVAINIILGLTPYIDNFIHLGGLVYGICCGWSTIEYTAVNFFGYDATFWTKARLYAFRFLGLIISVVCIIVTSAWLATFQVGDNPCPKCRYFNCVETKWWHCNDCDVVTADLYRTDTAIWLEKWKVSTHALI
jgi:hypothetical protein